MCISNSGLIANIKVSKDKKGSVFNRNLALLN